MTGFWIAKFEASGTKVENGTTYAVGNYIIDTESNTTRLISPEDTTTVKILPNVISWRSIKIGDCQYRCMQMSNDTSTYGWSNINTHLIKNCEWGAVSYLCYSKYGVVPSKNGAGINGNHDLYTGTGPQNGKADDNSSYNYLDNTTTQAYNGINGKLASTTGNEFGVYDMSGGACELVAAYLDNKNDYLTAYGNSKFISYFNNSKELNPIYSLYWDKYEVSSDERNNEIPVIGELGTIDQRELWDSSKTEEKYINTRHTLTQSNFENLEKYKGIGVNEMTTNFSFYTTFAYKKENTENSEILTKWDWFVNVSTAVERASGTSNSDEPNAYTWNRDLVSIGHAFHPFVMRGAAMYNASGAGVLNYRGIEGAPYDGIGFKPVLCP